MLEEAESGIHRELEGPVQGICGAFVTVLFEESGNLGHDLEGMIKPVKQVSLIL